MCVWSCVFACSVIVMCLCCLGHVCVRGIVFVSPCYYVLCLCCFVINDCLLVCVVCVVFC